MWTVGRLRYFWPLISLFCSCRSWKRSRRSWRTRPGCSAACQEKNPAANRSQRSRATRLLCSGNRQLWANPASSRLWFNLYKVRHSHVKACMHHCYMPKYMMHNDHSSVEEIINTTLLLCVSHSGIDLWNSLLVQSRVTSASSLHNGSQKVD